MPLSVVVVIHIRLIFFAAMIRRASVAFCVVLASLLLSSCDGVPDVPLSEAGERGRKFFRYICAACHNGANPHANGIQGPAVAGSSRELLEAKVLRGAYPPGYQPKRNTVIMQKLPATMEQIGDLAAFLAEIPAPGG